MRQYFSQTKTVHFTKIRDWCTLMPAGATLKNCYRARKGDGEGDDSYAVPQSFTFMVREGGVQYERIWKAYVQK